MQIHIAKGMDSKRRLSMAVFTIYTNVTAVVSNSGGIPSFDKKNSHVPASAKLPWLIML